FLMIRPPTRATRKEASAASDVSKSQRITPPSTTRRPNPTEEVVPGTGVSQNDLDDLAHQLQQLLPGF
ncbi:hypothetical protein, partial [Corynebacterium belfantii]|uniref:hypothetical protein n=1 Tax=Corynebacterium belfantii TaxID=2014537 RepID=UPI001A7E4EE9